METVHTLDTSALRGELRRETCWCGGLLGHDIDERYGRCPECQSLVLRRSYSAAELAELYSWNGYWHTHQVQDLGTPTIETRAWQDFYDRIPYWHSALRRLKPNPEYILEIGCGHGGFLALQKMQGVPHVVGVEVDEGTCQYAKRCFGLEHIVAGLYPDVSLPYPDYDLICGFDVLEHLTDPLRFLQAVRSQLRPRGACLFQTPCFFDQDSSWKHRIAEHTFLYSRCGAQRLLEAAGLTPLAICQTQYSDEMYVVGRI